MVAVVVSATEWCSHGKSSHCPWIFKNMSKRAKKGQSVAVNHHQALQRLCWRERECKFDIPLPNLLEPVYGEIFIDSLNDVEDTKGNPGQSGRLIVTNLRIIWHSHKDAKINISIGLFAAVRLEIRTTESRLRGRTRSLFITARNVIRSKQIRYQFIFTNVVEGSPRLFTTIQAVNKAYDSTRLYREIRVRSSITSDYQLNLLPREHILEVCRNLHDYLVHFFYQALFLFDCVSLSPMLVRFSTCIFPTPLWRCKFKC